jgi:hypothetical protein
LRGVTRPAASDNGNNLRTGFVHWRPVENVWRPFCETRTQRNHARLSAADLSRSGLPREYWRKRLQAVMQNHQLSPAQFDEIDRILAALND